MPRIAMPGPWAYAAGGLTGGLGEGLMLGMQARKQRESEEQAKQARAMQLLMGFQKIAAQDPESAKALEPQIAAAYTKITKQPWTGAQIPTAQEQMQRQLGMFKTGMEEVTRAFPQLSEEDRLHLAASLANISPWKGRGSGAMPYATYNEETGRWEIAAGPGGTPVRPWQPRAPQDPYRHGGFYGSPETGYQYYTPTNPPPPYALPPSKAPTEKPPGAEPGTPATIDEIKAFHKAKQELEKPGAEKDPNYGENLSIVQQFEDVHIGKQPGKIPGGVLEGLPKFLPWTEGSKQVEMPKVEYPSQLMKRRRLPPGGAGQGQNRNELEKEARRRGWVQRPDGTWGPPGK